jgi:hypothetical protein
MKKKELSRLTALTLQRDVPSVEVPVNKIRVRDDVEHDPIFHNMYTRFLRGKLTTTSSRLPLAMIAEGFYRPGDDEQVEYRCDNPDPSIVRYIMKMMRRGHRPPLYVYKNIKPDDPRPFVCPDDVAPHRAYTQLGIAVVPVHILSRGETPLTESGIVMRSYPTKRPVWPPVHMEGTIATTHRMVPGFLGMNLRDDHVASLDLLREPVQEAMRKLDAFHDRDDSSFHYHHTLHSYLYRLDEAIHACSVLIKEDLWYPTVPVLRSIYEASLNFYLEWLSPESTHLYFKLNSTLTKKDVDRVITASALGADAGEDRSWKASVKRMTTLAGNVREKAALSPTGVDFHERIYSFLSGVAHQDFHMVAEYANTFLGASDRPNLGETDQRFIIQCLDVVAGMICTRVMDDIGTVQEPVGTLLNA